VTPPLAPAADYSGELKKFAGPRNQGIITEEEFQAKKKQILGLQPQRSIRPGVV
jgi:hypothetical protein